MRTGYKYTKFKGIKARVSVTPNTGERTEGEDRSRRSSPGGTAVRFFERVIQKIDIGHLLIILFALHLFALSFPSDTSNGGGMVFDEAYYVPASLDLLHGIASNLEHPFFGKFWGSLGIGIFGNNFFGWRIFYAVIGVLAVWIMYELARVFFSKEKALFAAAMLGFENLFFIHTSLLLLEGPPILFALLGFLLYFRKRYYLSGIAFGLCILSKETGVFFLGALLLYHIWAHWDRKMIRRLQSWKKLLTFVVIVLLVVGMPLWAYDSLYQPFRQTTESVTVQVVVSQPGNVTTTTTRTSTQHSGPVSEPIQNFLYYFRYQSSLKGCGTVNAWNCYPWNWVLPFNVSPLQYFVNTVTLKTTAANGTTTTAEYHPIDWQGVGNLVVWYSIWLVVPIAALNVARKRAGRADVLALSTILATYGPLFYLSLVTTRVEYAFYFIYTDVGLALGIPVAVSYIARGSQRYERLLMAGWLIATLAFFVMFFPVNPFAFK